MGRVMEATESFAYEDRILGPTVIEHGITRIDENHPLAKRFPQHFRFIDENLTYDIEEATDNPGEHRNRARSKVESKPESKTIAASLATVPSTVPSGE